MRVGVEELMRGYLFIAGSWRGCWLVHKAVEKLLQPTFSVFSSLLSTIISNLGYEFVRNAS